MTTIPQTPVEALYCNSPGVWGSLSTHRLDQLEIRRSARNLLDRSVQTSKDEIRLHAMLTQLLAENYRLALYLPMSLIPEANDLRINQSTDEFVDQFLHSWYKLLTIHEPRANYTDGDLHMSPDTPMIVPAAYLTPALIKKGLVAANSPHGDNLRPIASNISPDQRRMNWIKKEQERQRIQKFGAAFSQKILKNGVSSFDINDTSFDQIVIVGLGKAIETAKSPEMARHIFEDSYQQFSQAVQNAEHYDIATIVLRRLFNLGFISASELHGFNICPTNLYGPILSLNLFSRLPEIKSLESLLRTDSELLKIIYPTMVLYGSALKGYGSPDSDLDTIVFIRPELCPINDLQRVERILDEKLPGTAYCWLKQMNSINEAHKLLKIHDVKPEANDPRVRTEYDAHNLFSGVWIGDTGTKKKLCDELLVPISRSGDQRLLTVLRQEMERNLLQYRLLHRGYETYYPTTDPTFLDEGYRMLATKLYLSNVFIP